MRQLAADRDRVAQPGRPLGGCHADPVVALATEQLRRLSGDVAQPREHGSGGSEESVLAGSGGQLSQPRAEHESALQIAGDQAVVLQCDGQSVGGRTSESGGGDQPGQRRRT